MVKRLNYFDGQFLRAQDFTDEQSYQIGMRRKHNSLLHTWGVAGGLWPSADKGAIQAKISPGFAIDILGNEIQLDKEALTDDLTTWAGKSPYITIEWSEADADRTTEAGGSGVTRKELSPIVKVSTDTPTEGVQLVLGTVTLDANGHVTTIDPTTKLRIMAGVNGGDLHAVALTLTNLDVAPDLQPRLSVTTARQVDLKGSLQVQGNLGVTGNVGIGTTSAGARLEIAGTTAAAGILKLDGGDVSQGDGKVTQIAFGYNGSAQYPSFIATRHNTIPANNAILFYTGDGTANGVFPGNAVLGLAINNGNVGIGTANPLQKLDVSGGGIGFSGNNLKAADKKLYSPADGDLEWMTNNGAGAHGFAISHQGAKAVYLNTNGNSYLNGGNVGIGTPNPNYKLEVNGNVLLGGFTADEKDEWPNVVWYRDGSKNWDEGVIKGDASKSWFGRAGFGIHMHQSRHFGFYSTNWDRLVDIEGASGKMYVKGGLHTGCDPRLRAPQPGDNPNQNSAAIYLGSSDVYFTDPNHFHTGYGNDPSGFAAIENAKNYEALMILGRFGSTFAGASARRVVRVWDYMQVNGNLNVTGVIQGRYGDLAEIYFSDIALDPGELVCLDPAADRIIRSREAHDAAVIGIVSSNPGVLLNAPETEAPAPDGGKGYPIALCGRVPCKVTDENGPIQRGDALTASSKPGHAMRAEPIMVDGRPLHRPGTLVGKALESHGVGDGVIDVFVALR